MTERPVAARPPAAPVRPPAAPGRAPASLRGRLVTAFAAVALLAVALVTGAAVIGADRGLSAQAGAARRATADRAAASAADAYGRAGGWAQADLGPAAAVASGADARLVVRDVDGNVVAWSNGQGRLTGRGGDGVGPMGPMGGMGPMMAGRTTADQVSAPVVAGGTTVGTVTLLLPGAGGTAGRPVAWTWVGAAAVAALTLAVAAAWLITRSLTRPLAVLTTTARAFAAGDRTARARLGVGGELGELAAAFDAAAEQVEVSERARRQVSADVAHELRTPLAALQAGLEELRDGLAPAGPEALARLHDQTLRLGRVVADLAELAAADAARLTLRRERLDLAAVAASAADAHEPHLRAAGLTLVRRFAGPAAVDGDPERLHQVAGNLFANCARHCRPGDTVTVETWLEDGVARLRVADTGPGIAPADLPHVFTRFWRATERAGAAGRSSTGGSGLGLAVVRSLVEAHGGTATVTSDGRSGTQVTVTLPRAR